MGTSGTRRRPSRDQLETTKRIVLPDDVEVIRYTQMVEWLVEGQHSVREASAHFQVNQNIVREAIKALGVTGHAHVQWQRSAVEEPAGG